MAKEVYMMADINLDGVLDATERLARKVTTIEGWWKGPAFYFDQCMRAFDCEALPAEAITFEVYYLWPVCKEGLATIHRDGQLVMRTGAE